MEAVAKAVAVSWASAVMEVRAVAVREVTEEAGTAVAGTAVAVASTATATVAEQVVVTVVMAEATTVAAVMGAAAMAAEAGARLAATVGMADRWRMAMHGKETEAAVAARRHMLRLCGCLLPQILAAGLRK